MFENTYKIMNAMRQKKAFININRQTYLFSVPFDKTRLSGKISTERAISLNYPVNEYFEHRKRARKIQERLLRYNSME